MGQAKRRRDRSDETQKGFRYRLKQIFHKWDNAEWFRKAPADTNKVFRDGPKPRIPGRKSRKKGDQK